MNPFPGKNSVLVMDNARIHHNAEWISVIEELGGRVLFLPPYSPDFNPIELAFSTIKAWLRRNSDFVHACRDHIYPLLLACTQITPEMAKGYFNKSIYS
jgi:transposase